MLRRLSLDFHTRIVVRKKGIVSLPRGWETGPHEYHIAQLPTSSFFFRNHQPRRVALLLVLTQFSRGRRINVCNYPEIGEEGR